MGFHYLPVINNLQIGHGDFLTLVRDGPVRPTVETLKFVLGKDPRIHPLLVGRLFTKYPNPMQFTGTFKGMWGTEDEVRDLF
jgi:hypothetical protein